VTPAGAGLPELLEARAATYHLVSPEYHRVRAANLVHDLFEKSPTDWSWIEGAFRMDCRWACQNQWNFMACGSTGVPMMVSKRTFQGDQIHEYYVSLRPVFPWDAGDPHFAYDPSTDANWTIFVANHGWYNRHDFNFSFCTDGRHPFSGYSILFGADDNTETRLLRGDTPVAATRLPTFLFPTAVNHGVIHWRWWKFTVRRFGADLHVLLNDTPLFQYTDPSPIAGGHAALWSVRNGFAVARMSSMADAIAWDPHVLYVENTSSSPVWRAMPHDSASLGYDAATGVTTAQHTIGTGSFALRWQPSVPVDLRRTPVMELPIAFDDSVAVNLHLAINGRSWVVRVNAPTDGMKAVLTPEFERGECFQLPVMSPDRVAQVLLADAPPVNGVIRLDLLRCLEPRGVTGTPVALETLTVGNTSNTGYLLAGHGGTNPAGAVIRLGTPTFAAAAP
jgi:hypothetical protein